MDEDQNLRNNMNSAFKDLSKQFNEPFYTEEYRILISDSGMKYVQKTPDKRLVFSSEHFSKEKIASFYRRMHDHLKSREKDCAEISTGALLRCYIRMFQEDYDLDPEAKECCTALKHYNGYPIIDVNKIKQMPKSELDNFKKILMKKYDSLEPGQPVKIQGIKKIRKTAEEEELSIFKYARDVYYTTKPSTHGFIADLESAVQYELLSQISK